MLLRKLNGTREPTAGLPVTLDEPSKYFLIFVYGKCAKLKRGPWVNQEFNKMYHDNNMSPVFLMK